ncbi:uncharacterized protein EI90DRAFT_2096388 [Cantharellus anzutake]|uniref:uncharacterized protein n=1 Tax=Cantharellus anzutake TaxID=1750568 RepID=UPI001904CC70|nr:uncharacterized protein EI90DRAFT_2096388 [Cantharellus anzutake]KAF8340663.1 hypothetical protein EI90DRAFT_2096388 [Cantharellus anzutake]
MDDSLSKNYFNRSHSQGRDEHLTGWLSKIDWIFLKGRQKWGKYRPGCPSFLCPLRTIGEKRAESPGKPNALQGIPRAQIATCWSNNPTLLQYVSCSAADGARRGSCYVENFARPSNDFPATRLLQPPSKNESRTLGPQDDGPGPHRLHVRLRQKV